LINEGKKDWIDWEIKKRWLEEGRDLIKESLKISARF